MRWRTIFGSYESKIRATLLGILLASLITQAGTSIMLYYAHQTIEAELMSPLYESLDALTIGSPGPPIIPGAVLDLSRGLDTHFEFALKDTADGAPASLWNQLPPAARKRILTGHTAKVHRRDGHVVEFQLTRILKRNDDVRVVSVGRELVAYSRFLTIETWNTISRTVGLFLLLAAVFLVTREMTQPFRRLRSVVADAKASLKLTGSPAYEDWDEVLSTFNATIDKLKASQAELQKRYVHSEAERLRLDQFNQQVIQSIPAGLIAADEQGLIVQHNAALLDLPGASVPGADEPLQDYFRHWPQLNSIFVEQPSDRWAGQQGECLIKLDGETYYLDYDIVSVPGGGTLVLINDRTHLRRLETLLAQRARLAVLGETAAGLAHELRNAMGAIVGYARLVEKSGNTSAVSIAARIEREAGEMEAMLQRFLDVARPAALQRQDVDSHELISTLTSGFARRLEQTHIKLQIDEGPRTVVHLDPMWLKRAMENLLENAQQHLKPGGHITVEARTLHDTWQLSVADNGPGIAPELREKIFAPFVTLRPGGTGLGLALVEKVMTAHEGTVELTSSVTEGSRFTLVFPHAVVEPKAAGISTTV